MNVTKYQLVIAGLILVIGFQNCSQSSFETSGQETQASKLQNAVAETQTIGGSPGFPQPNEDVVITSKSKVTSVSSYDDAGQVDMKIDLQGPAAVTLHKADMVIVAGCLESKRLNFLKNLLNGVSLCQADKISDSSISCTHQYKLAYASLGVLSAQIPLGAGNPCDGNQVYFCTKGADNANVEHQLKVFLRDLKNNLSSLEKCLQ